jgi:phosphoenolpyruvate-protein kinase (PTS system EI component)
MGELALQGVSAAPGVTVGKAVLLDPITGREAKTVHPAARPHELELARAALALAATELDAIAARLREAGRNEEADIVETGVLMAGDPTLVSRVESLINGSGLAAPDALCQAADQFAAELALLADPMLAQRADDLRSLGRRAAARAAGVKPGGTGGVLIASTLGPADVAELGAAGIALAGGGITAHAAIVARSLGVPMVVGLGPAVLEVENGEEVVLDGDRGLLVQRPETSRVTAARAEGERRRLARQRAVADRLHEAVTKDGHRVHVLANASTVAEAVEGLAQGAEGVGLVRTELLFLDSPAWPTYEQQVNFLKPIFAQLPDLTVTVRLFDFGGDKTPLFLRGTTARGVELLLGFPEALKTQLAAVVDAGTKVKLRLLVPMVTTPDQLRAVRAVLATVVEGRVSPLLGSMIETPESALNAGAIATESDFFSIGTNDLTQLVLGLDRERSKSAPVTDVRVLRLIDATTRAARSARILVDVCGEAASDAVAMPILVGLGVDELSVAAARVGEVRQWVRELSFASSRERAEALLREGSHAGRERV